MTQQTQTQNRHTASQTQTHDTQAPRHTSTATQAPEHTDTGTQVRRNTVTQAHRNPDTRVANRASLARRDSEEDPQGFVCCMQMPKARVPRCCEEALRKAPQALQLRALPIALEEVGGRTHVGAHLQAPAFIASRSQWFRLHTFHAVWSPGSPCASWEV